MQPMHLDEEQIQRLLHGELAPAADTSARQHLAECADCRRRIAEAEREEDEVYALLRQVDHPPPPVDADAIAARARTRNFGWGRRAAGILVALGLAGAAYAAPGSPLPAWVEAVKEWIGDRPDSSPSAPAPVQAPEPRVAGIAVDPGQNLLILFTSPHAEGQAQVWLTDGTEVVVRAPIGAAIFSSDVDRLVIENHGSPASFEIGIPRSAPRVEIRVGGNRIFLKEGSRVRTEKSTDAQGLYLLPLMPSRS
jgi:hypothetical protein